jgi:transposase
MLGKKYLQPKVFTNFNLADRVPENNFYRRLKAALQLDFLYEKTKPYYGSCGQKSIDPTVFFKLMLIGYLENIVSDRELIRHCSMRLDILFFLDYDIDEELPWHSTLSRTRQLLPQALFEEVFDQVLSLCITAGMVAGYTQAVDSAYIKANASLDSLEQKQAMNTPKIYLKKVVEQDHELPPAEENHDDDYKYIMVNERKLKDIAAREKNWAAKQKRRPGGSNEKSKYLSNKLHYSPTDPQARVAVKPGKRRQLCYAAQLAVDTSHHVISHIQADFADRKDSQVLPTLLQNLQQRFSRHELKLRRLLADTAYSSGENYYLLEKYRIEGFIPAHGTYKQEKEGFTYDQKQDVWICSQGKKATFRRYYIERGNLVKRYYTKRKDCRDCPIKMACIGKQFEKKISKTAFQAQYERMISRVESKKGQVLKKKRQSTVEPVLGTLINFMGMRKVNTRGLGLAHKNFLLAAASYNLKKYLNFSRKLAQAKAQAMRTELSSLLETKFSYLNLN